jgi:large subunit ribosomal protein L15
MDRLKYNQLIMTKKHRPRRVGRGISSGSGKTAGRGTKGQGARKSGGVRPGFEGGQTPLYMRLPHRRGFKSRRSPRVIVYTGQLSDIRRRIIDNQTLAVAGLVDSPHDNVKLLHRGELAVKKDVKLQAASDSAQEALRKVGGSFTRVSRLARPQKANDTIK